MVDKLTKLEQALGGKLESKDAREIPGLSKIDGVEIVYFSDEESMSFRRQFKRITEYVTNPNAKNGGVNDRGCRIILPDGTIFHAIGYHGDLDGWRKDIEIGARELNLLLARIVNGIFVVSDGREFELATCGVKFN